MNKQHTPGPWRAQKPRGPQRAIDRKFEIVAPLKSGGEMVIIGEHTGIDCLTEANARLIAAAPDMLAALQICLGHLTGGLDGDWSADPIESARAAITKATLPATSGAERKG